MTTVSASAGFLAEPASTPLREQMHTTDRYALGYVANLTRVWAQCPEALATLSHGLALAVGVGRLEPRHRVVLATATGAVAGDSYCSIAWGSKLAATAGEQAAAGVLTGDDSGLDPVEQALADWARRVTRAPSETTRQDVDRLRALGFDDEQVFAVTLFVALRLAFSTVNDALGAVPDAELAAQAPAAVLAAVTFGRPPATAT